MTSRPSKRPTPRLRPPADWSPELAERVAERVGISPLEQEHWRVIAACREETARAGQPPTLPRIQELTGLGAREIARLFGGRIETLIALVAGLTELVPPSRAPGRRGTLSGGRTE